MRKRNNTTTKSTPSRTHIDTHTYTQSGAHTQANRNRNEKKNELTNEINANLMTKTRVANTTWPTLLLVTSQNKKRLNKAKTVAEARDRQRRQQRQ